MTAEDAAAAPSIRVFSGRILLAFLVLAAVAMGPPVPGHAQGEQTPVQAPSSTCERWVATNGEDAATGARSDPWASLQHAVDTVPDRGCTVTVAPGVYPGGVDISRRFSAGLVIRAAEPHSAVLEHSSTVVDLDGARNVVIEGFELRHQGPDSAGFIVSIDRGSEDVWSENVALRGNIIHDSYSNDLVKIHAGVRYALVEGNVFYNQGDSEQHIDVNSVTDVIIQDNVFFNDFEFSGRDAGTTKHFIVVKDSGRADDGLLGSRRIAIRRNIFMNWQGGREALVRVGNDGKPYFEAIDVQIESNLFIANSQYAFDAPVGVSGAKRVAFVNNTIVGDLAVGAFGFRAQAKGNNPKNRDLVFANNVWSDPGGGMRRFSSGSEADNLGLVLDSNLFWNAGASIPAGRVVSPIEDANGQIADPELGDLREVIVPLWNGRSFESGVKSIRSEFVRLVSLYASISAYSPAVDAANERCAPTTDILARFRDSAPDIGAWEALPIPTNIDVNTHDLADGFDPRSIASIVQRVHFGCVEYVPSDLFAFCDPADRGRESDLPTIRCII